MHKAPIQKTGQMKKKKFRLFFDDYPEYCSDIRRWRDDDSRYRNYEYLKINRDNHLAQEKPEHARGRSLFKIYKHAGIDVEAFDQVHLLFS